MALVGAALLVTAWRCDRAWFDRHVFLPYYYPYLASTRSVSPIRLGAAAVGAALVTLAGKLGTRSERRSESGALTSPRDGAKPSLWPGTIVALGAAVLAAEGVLRIGHLAWHEAGSARYELKVGHRDPRYGWRSTASRATRLTLAGRPSTYAIGPAGLRARSPNETPDLSRPSLIVAGESIASGYALDYDETFAARCGKDLGLQVADVGEGGYGFDQAYLRLADLLPQVARPVAVVTVFVPSQLGRSLRDDRPRLALDQAGTLQLLPPATSWMARSRLGALVRDCLPYAGDAALGRAMTLAGAVLTATAQQARARGAEPLFVVVSLGPPRPLDAHPEATIIRALFIDTGLPYLLIDLDTAERFAGDGHPNAAGARRIASAIEAALRHPAAH